MACIEVNLDLPESRENPIHQVVMHGGLSALIGVHGSHQTHAVWMPPHSFVLELLPYLWANHGSWTQSTHIPTMNGYMLQDTDINHVGHPLDYKRMPNCSLPMYTQGSSRDQNHHLNCNQDKNWSDRDFDLEWDIIERLVQDFVLEPVPRACNEFEATSRTDFVLYNVVCIHGDSIGVVLNNSDYDSSVASVVAADRKKKNITTTALPNLKIVTHVSIGCIANIFDPELPSKIYNYRRSIFPMIRSVLILPKMTPSRISISNERKKDHFFWNGNVYIHS
jgi:hypothetical protein